MLKKYLNICNVKVTRQDRLANFMSMSHDIFKTECAELMQDVMNYNIPNMYLFGRSLAF